MNATLTTTTTITQEQYMQALARAIVKQIKVVNPSGGNVDHAFYNEQGEQFWYATSSDPNHAPYEVTHVGKSLSCTCKAGQNGMMCLHRAAVHADLVYGLITMQPKEVETPVVSTVAPALRSRCEYGRSCNERATEIVEIAGGMDRHCCAYHAPKLREIYTWADAVKAADPDRVNPVVKSNAKSFLRK